MTPTSCTGAKWLADDEKKLPDPPRTLSALPNGVSTESSATEPTQRTVIRKVVSSFCPLASWPPCVEANRPTGQQANRLHPFRRGDSQQLQSVLQHQLRGARQHQTRIHD